MERLREPGRVLPAEHVLVTGGAGYIGSHLVDWLVDDGCQVSVLDDLSNGDPRRLAAPLARGAVRLVAGSVLDQPLVEREARRADLVFHLAAAVGVRRIVDDPLASLRTNVLGAENVLRACAEHGSKVVLASSSEIYGKTPDIPMSESGDRLLGPTVVPRWSYAAAKAVDEHLVFAYAQLGLRAAVVRYFNSYGPRLSRAGDASVVGVFLRRALAGEPLLLHGDGRQTRCFTYVSDSVRGTVLAAAVAEAEGRAFNIGSDVETSIGELARMVIDATGSRSQVQRIPYEAAYGPRFQDVRRRMPDISSARDILGWEAEVPLAEGIKRTIARWGEGDG